MPAIASRDEPHWVHWTAVFDGNGRQIASVDPLGHTTSIGYDSADRPVTITDPLGNTSSSVYDANNRAIANLDPLGNTTSLVSIQAEGSLAGQIHLIIFIHMYSMLESHGVIGRSAGQSHDARVRRCQQTRELDESFGIRSNKRV